LECGDRSFEDPEFRLSPATLADQDGECSFLRGRGLASAFGRPSKATSAAGVSIQAPRAGGRERLADVCKRLCGR